MVIRYQRQSTARKCPGHIQDSNALTLIILYLELVRQVGGINSKQSLLLKLMLLHLNLVYRPAARS